MVNEKEVRMEKLNGRSFLDRIGQPFVIKAKVEATSSSFHLPLTLNSLAQYFIVAIDLHLRPVTHSTRLALPKRQSNSKRTQIATTAAPPLPQTS